MLRVFEHGGIDALQDIGPRSCPAYFPGVVDEARTEGLDMPVNAGKVEGTEDLLKHGFKSKELGAEMGKGCGDNTDYGLEMQTIHFSSDVLSQIIF